MNKDKMKGRKTQSVTYNNYRANRSQEQPAWRETHQEDIEEERTIYPNLGNEYQPRL